MPKMFEGNLNGDGLRVAIVIARFNGLVSDRLLDGALDALVRHGVLDEAISVVRVPGSFEIPQAARTLARSGDHDAIVCLGAVVRGDTAHFESLPSEFDSIGPPEVSLSTRQK